MLIITFPILFVLKFVLENIGIILIIASVTCVVIAIVAAIISAANGNAAKEAERQNHLDIINSSKTMPTLISLPNSTAFSNAEETEINQQYRKFIIQIYTLIKELSHLDFLSNEEEVYRGTSRYEEVPRLDERYTILQESRAI